MDTKTPTTSLLAQPVASEDLKLFRAFITDGLCSLSSKTNSEFTYPELLEACTERAATFFIVSDILSLDIVGFFVVTPFVREDGISLEISSAFAAPSAPSGVLTYCLQKAAEFAILIEAKRVLFRSPRKGWRKVALGLGFKLDKKQDDKYYFSKEINYHAIR